MEKFTEYESYVKIEKTWRVFDEKTIRPYGLPTEMFTYDKMTSKYSIFLRFKMCFIHQNKSDDENGSSSIFELYKEPH